MIWGILAFLILILIAGFLWLDRRLRQAMAENHINDELREWLKNSDQRWQQSSSDISRLLQQTQHNLQTALQLSSKTTNERLDKAAQFIAKVAREVGEMSEIGQSIRELQNVLQSPKLRGNIGEEVLKDIIGQMFPKNSFHLQYQFKSGEKVDAALKTEAGILPIDSKFPMENFRKMVTAKTKTAEEQARRQFVNDVRRHIRTIAKKYILPEEGTVDFALMYVPAETVFYEIINNPELVDYARQFRVYLVSPNSLYIHLQTILLSFEGKRIEAQSRQIFRLLRAIQNDYQKTETAFMVLSRHLNNAVAKMNEVFQSFTLLGQKISNANQLPRGQKTAITAGQNHEQTTT